MKTAFVLCLGILQLWMLAGCKPKPNGDDDVDTAFGLVEQRRFVEAIPLLEAGLQKGLRHYSKSDVLTTIGNCYNETEDYALSLEYHDRALVEDPSNHMAHVNKGIVYRLLGEFENAQQCYEEALRLEPDYAELHASMGALAVHMEDVPKAITHLERAVKLDPTLPVAHSNLAYAYALAGRFEEADAQLGQAVLRGYHQPEVIRARIDELRAALGGK